MPGQRLPDTARLAGLRGAQRHPRRVRLPDPRHQAVGGAPPARRTPCDDHVTHAEDCRVDDVLLRPGLSMYLPDRHPARRPRPGRRQPPRHHRHQPADLARPGSPHRRPAARRGRRPAPACRLARRAATSSPRASSTGSRRWRSRWPRSTRPTAVDRETQRFLTSRNSRLRGGLHDVLAVDRIGPDTVLRRRAGRPVRRHRGRATASGC